MGVRSDAAGAGHKVMRIARITALENKLDTSEHLARAPCIDNFTAGYFDFDPEVALNPGNWINNYTFTHIYNLFLSLSMVSSE